MTVKLIVIQNAASKDGHENDALLWGHLKSREQGHGNEK